MTPIHHRECTEIYFERGARRWGGEQQVAPMPVKRTAEHGRRCFVSFWKPSPRELADLQSGGLVALRLFGDVHPVVTITTSESS